MSNQRIKGVIFIIIASISFGIMPILARLAYSHNANPFSVLFLRFLFAAIILLYYIKKNKIALKLSKQQMLFIIFLGAVGYSITSISLFIAYNYITVGLATMIMYTYPIIVTLLSFWIYKEKLHSRKILSLLVSFLGLYMLIGVGVARFNIFGIGFAFLSALFYSVYVIGTSNSTIKNVNSYVMTFYVSLAASVTIFSVGVATKRLEFNMDFYAIICIILLAFISTVVALMAFIRGVRIIGPSNASILSTIEPLVSMVLGFIILGEEVSLKVIFGSVLILVSIIILTLEKRKK